MSDPVQICENAAVESTEEKSHSRLLTRQEWAEAEPPFHYLKIDFDKWTELEYEIALKYILRQGSGWVYYDNHRFILEKEEDYVLFRLWIENKPMQDKESLAIP